MRGAHGRLPSRLPTIPRHGIGWARAVMRTRARAGSAGSDKGEAGAGAQGNEVRPDGGAEHAQGGSGQGQRVRRGGVRGTDPHVVRVNDEEAARAGLPSLARA